MKIIAQIIEFLNKIDSRLFIFLVLCLNLLSFKVHSNEEAYFPLAKQFIDPSWIPGSFTFTEWVGTRFFFQYIAGFALKYWSFEQLAFWGGMFNYACYAFPLALIFKELKIKNLGILVILQIFIINLSTQHFFGREWIFGGFEGKTLAYVFIFYAFYYLLKAKYIQVVLFAAIASYFHILVGGWYFVMAFIYVLVTERNIKLLLRMGMVYLLIVSPFIFFLSSHLDESGSIINGVNIDWVYSFFRNTHHTAPMHVPNAMQEVFPRVVLSFILLLLSIFYFRKSPDTNIRKLNRIAIISLCMLFVGLLITYIDTGGHLLKYYLFRIASIGAFTYYIIVFLFLRNLLYSYIQPGYVNAITFLLILTLLCFRTANNFKKNIFYKENPNFIALVSYVQEHTQPSNIYLFLEKEKYEEESFSRRTRREALVIFKFDPGGGDKIYEWYSRVQDQQKLQNNINYIDTLKVKYKLNYLITKQSVTQSSLKEVYHNTKYHLYEVIGSE